MDDPRAPVQASLNISILRGRVMDLPRPNHPTRLCLLVEDRLEILIFPEPLQAVPDNKVALGDLVEVWAEQGVVKQLARIGGVTEAWHEQGDALRWRRAGEEPSRMAVLRLRHAVLREIRAWFDEQGFLEVETPAWSAAPNPEPQFEVVSAGDGYLITSPEFHLKRLLVGGFDRVYRLGPVFRGGEVGRHHNPEFTLLEWYRCHEGLDAMAADLEQLMARLAPFAINTAQGDSVKGWSQPPFHRATVAELFREYLGMEMVGVTHLEALKAAVREAGVLSHNAKGGEWVEADSLPEDFERAFFALWDRMEQRFPPTPLLVTEWPAPLASLARMKPGDPTVALRMELYAGGLELANGFDELTDGAEQRMRFEADRNARRIAGLPDVPLDERFLAALEQGMPPAAGMALGVDRLVMLLAGVDTIRDVIPFAFDER